MLDQPAGDTRVFLFHSEDAAGDPGGAMDKVNSWLGKDRSQTQYANLRVKDISISSDGKGGVYTIVVCSLGRAGAAAGPGPAV
ncbi:MAG: hypothetical protein ACRDJH_25440 [Thermomicrobiales bacterium]